MNWQFWGGRLQELPEAVKDYLFGDEFDLSMEEILSLRCRRRKGNYGGKRAIYIEIVDPALPNKVLFKGIIERGNFVSLRSLRTDNP